MTATGQNDEMIAGTDRTLRFSVVDENGTAKNLSGLQAASWKLKRKTGGTALITKTLGAGVSLYSAAGGVVDVELAPADTATLQGSFLHELRLTDVDGDIATAAVGYLTIKATLI